MKDTFYFSHDYNARQDSKIKKLLAKHGLLGYGIFWSLIEDLYNNANALPTDYDSIAYDLRTDKNLIKDIVENYDLFVIDSNLFGSTSVQKRLEARNEKSATARLSAIKRWEKMRTQSEVNANALQSDSEGNAIKESKGNEKKENEINSFKVSISAYGGTKRGAATELENLKKKHKDWKDILPLIAPAIENQKKYREAKKAKGEFVAEWKNLQTWINQRCWEEVIPTFQEVKKNEYNIVLPDMTGGYKEKV